MVASEKPQQETKSGIATSVDKNVANSKKYTDASDPSQTGKVGASKDSPKTYNQRKFKLNSLQKMLVQKRIKKWKMVMAQQHQSTRKTIPQNLAEKKHLNTRKNDSIHNFKTEPSADEEGVSKYSNKLAPSVANSDHLGEDVGTAPSEKNDNDLEEGDGRETSDEEQSTSSLGSTASSNNITNPIGKMVPQGKFKGKEQVEEQQERDQEQEKSRIKRNQKKMPTYCKEQGFQFCI
jgi:hypothetical protein